MGVPINDNYKHILIPEEAIEYARNVINTFHQFASENDVNEIAEKIKEEIARPTLNRSFFAGMILGELAIEQSSPEITNNITETVVDNGNQKTDIHISFEKLQQMAEEFKAKAKSILSIDDSDINETTVVTSTSSTSSNFISEEKSHK